MLILSLTHLPTTLASCVTYSHTLGDDDVLLPSGDIDSDDDNDDDDEKDSDDSDDEDESLGQLRRLSRKSQLDYWCKRHKPLKNETEDEFAKRAMLMVDRGLVAQNKLRKLKDNEAKWVNQEEEGNIDIGIGARIFYEGIHGRSHTKPIKEDCGAQGLGSSTWASVQVLVVRGGLWWCHPQGMEGPRLGSKVS